MNKPGNGRDESYLLGKIVKKFENSGNDWREECGGNRSIKIQQSDYDCFGKSELIEEARKLEKKGLIRVTWFCGGSEMEKITYRLQDMAEIYRMLGIESKKCRLQKVEECIRRYEEQAESSWLKDYYGDLFQELEKGKCPSDFSKYGELLFHCLNEMEKLKEPMLIRIFSTRYLGGSKVFEKTLKSRVVSIGRKYHPMIDEAMSEYEVLSQLYLEHYAQELALKGELQIVLNGKRNDLGMFPYGLILNSETLKAAEIPPEQRIRKVITVENKANYTAMAYEKGTLILFCHGFFSPREREFLIKLEKILKEQRQAGWEIQYYHTGDLDYGGVQIFRYNRLRIFPELKPLHMDVSRYEQYFDYAADMDPSAWEKLQGIKEPLLQPLIDRILEEKRVIEQECFLF